MKLMYSDIKDDTREEMILEEIYELYWVDFTEDFQKRFMEEYGDIGNYDLFPLMVCLHQSMVDGVESVVEFERRNKR